MNKSLVLFDRNNNVQKKANIIVKFNFEEKDYLVYSIEENEQNDQIFVSKIILNSEGKYFIDNVLLEEKNKLNNIVYNIVILLPSEVQKGISFDILSKNLDEKFGVKLSFDIPQFTLQEYFSNCSVAITSKLLVSAAVNVYEENLNSANDNNVLIPTWTAPSLVTAPTPMVEEPVVSESVVVPSPSSTIPVQEAMPGVTLQPSPDVNHVNTNDQNILDISSANVSVEATPKVDSVATVDFNSNIQVNPQLEKLAIVSDPSLGIGVSQPNLGKNKKAGYANTKYIVIGTVCLLLAVAVVITAYILIKNMQ